QQLLHDLAVFLDHLHSDTRMLSLYAGDILCQKLNHDCFRRTNNNTTVPPLAYRGCVILQPKNQVIDLPDMLQQLIARFGNSYTMRYPVKQLGAALLFQVAKTARSRCDRKIELV